MVLSWQGCVLQVHVSPGMCHNQKIPFRGKADEIVSVKAIHWGNVIHALPFPLFLSPLPLPPFSPLHPSQPDGDAGDVIVILQEEDHPVFRRADIDLIMTKTITLNEALCGCEFIVKHLDGQQLLVKTRPGEVIAPGKTSNPPQCALCMRYRCEYVQDTGFYIA